MSTDGREQRGGDLGDGGMPATVDVSEADTEGDLRVSTQHFNCAVPRAGHLGHPVGQGAALRRAGSAAISATW